MDKQAESRLSKYRFHRKLNLDILESLNQSDLASAPLRSAGSFGKQFRHLLDIEKCYIDSLAHDSLDFFREDIDHSLELSRDRLLKEMTEYDLRLESIVGSMPGDMLMKKSIDCTRVTKYIGSRYERASPFEILYLMTEHEVFHEGELALYFRTMGRRLPPSWEYWGLSSF